MNPHTLSDFTVKNNLNESVSLAQYAGQVVLVVNTASACRFTPQYAQLQQLHERYSAQGLQILAFPCNQFLQQEQGDNAEIQQFCERFSVGFPIMDKIEVNGARADPFWQWLRRSAPGVLGSTRIKWNFTKFLIARDGQTVQRFAPVTSPLDIVGSIEALLKS
ncbi:MAG: bsaA [Burkholderiaceae bacterium]|nr:bsaA [Burkholderiaceae bacterium]